MSNGDGKKAQQQANQGQADKAMTMAQIKKKKRGVTAEVTIQLDGEIATALSRLRARHAEAQAYDKDHNVPETAPAIQEEIDQLIEEARDTEVVFVFKSIGAQPYDDLLAEPENQPTEAQRKDGADFNPETFPAALIAAACVDPEISLEDAREMFVDPAWNPAELQRLFFGALEVNTEVADIPLSGTGTGMTRGMLRNLISAASGESPTPSS
jgi:hypothetical protein